MTDHDASLAAALSLLATKIALVPDLENAFVAGSAAAGFGNPTSDIDVFISGSPKAVETVRDSIPPFIGSRRIDIELIDEVGLALATENLRCLAQEIPGAKTSVLYAADRDLKIVGAAIHSMQLRSPLLSHTSHLIQDHAVRRAYRRVLCARSNVWINNTAEDVYGLVQSGDDLPTRRRAHNLLELAIDQWLTSNGQDYPDEKYKWITHRLRRLELSERDQRLLLDHYHPEQAPASTPLTALVVASIAQVLRGRSVLKEFFSIDLSDIPLKEVDSSEDEVHCLPWLILGVEDRNVRATTPQGSWDVPPGGLVLLALAHGRTADAIVETAAKVLDRSRVHEMSTSDIWGLLDKLRDLQMIGNLKDAPTR